MEAEFECPVCRDSTTLEIEDSDADSQTFKCPCGASLDLSYTVTAEVDEIEVTGGVTAEYECPRCGDTDTLEITEESGEEEVTCVCGVTLSVSWSSWGRETTAEVTGATIEYDCPECGDSSNFEISTKSGEEEVECDCGATLSVSWSDWGKDVEVPVIQVASKGGEDDDEKGEEKDGDEEDEDEEDEDPLFVTENAWLAPQ